MSSFIPQQFLPLQLECFTIPSVFRIFHREYDVGESSYKTERCFITDLTSPDHCANNDPPCEDDVFEFGYRVRRDRILDISFSGWFDPLPDVSNPISSGSMFRLYHFLKFPCQKKTFKIIKITILNISMYSMAYMADLSD